MLRKALPSLLMFALFVLLLKVCCPGLLPLLVRGDSDAIIAYLDGPDHPMTILLIALMQIIQLISVAIPALPIHAAAGLVLGTVSGFFLCWLSFLAANLFVFLSARRMKEKHRLAMPHGGTVGKLRQLLTEEGAPALLLVSLMPFFPNGIIPYIAADMDVETELFAASIAAGSAPPIFADCLAGRLILHGSVLAILAIYGILFLLCGITYLNRRRLFSVFRRK